jgi:transcriptional regulator with XRE-family HTH domain
VSTRAVEFGAALRKARRSKGLSQAELGGDKYSGSYISHLESGRRVATPEVVEFLTRRLGLSALEWGMSSRADMSRLDAKDPIEDLLVAERAWSDHDWDAAWRHASAAAEAATAAGDPGREWEARYVMAQTKFASGEFAEAAVLAEALADHQTARRFSVARAQALSLASISHRASDRLGWAVAFGARAVEAAASCPPIILAEALMSLVSALSESGHPTSESEHYIARLIELAPQLNSDHSRGMISWAVGAAAFVAGDVAEGLRQQEIAKTLLDPRRDLRLWLRFQSTAARWRLQAGVIDGVADLLHTASLGLQIIGNTYDLVELRQSEARLALLTGDVDGAIEIISGVLDDPVLGAAEVSRGQSELVFAECLRAKGDDEGARRGFMSAAAQLEAEGRYRAALDAWRQTDVVDPKEKFDKDLTPSVKSD